MKLITSIKRIAFTTVTTLMGLVAAVPAKAAEINPDPDSYTFGSTSEFSPYSATTGGGTSGGGSLAPTGDSQLIGLVAVVVLIIAAIGITVYLLKKRNKALAVK
jgi:hypothetical protein